MISSVTYHGKLHPEVEFYATITGPEIHRRFFLQQAEGEISLFSDKNFIRMTSDGIQYDGNGGCFNAYMFGTQIPPEDMFTEDVTNRLVFYGAFEDKDNGEIYFTTRTAGKETYEKIFLHGHAVSNYHFFVADHNPQRSVVERQEMTLKSIGKLLKRSVFVGQENDVELMASIRDHLQESRSDVFLFRFVHKTHREFRYLCNELYKNFKGFPQEELLKREELVNMVDSYQQERIKIDIIYNHPDNTRIIREYRHTLIHGRKEGRLPPSMMARLQRLRTIALRQNIPSNIFDTLEEILMTGKETVDLVEEPEYISKTRVILEGFLIDSGPFTHEVSDDELVDLLNAKQISVQQHNNAFEEVLLEAGRLIDEKVAQSEDFLLLESFGNVVTYLDRFDATSALINKVAFMDDIELVESNVRSLVNNRKIFNELQPNLFENLFIVPLYNNPYIPGYGRRKIEMIHHGVNRIFDNEMTIQELIFLISEITTEERFYQIVYQMANERAKHFYANLSTPHGIETFTKEIKKELARQQLIDAVPDRLIKEVIHDLQMESLYLSEILPSILETGDSTIREDFIKNSGLDLFIVEELEQSYFQLENMDPSLYSELLSTTHVA